MLVGRPATQAVLVLHTLSAAVQTQPVIADIAQLELLCCCQTCIDFMYCSMYASQVAGCKLDAKCTCLNAAVAHWVSPVVVTA